MDTNVYMLHFPLGIPIRTLDDTDIWVLDAKFEKCNIYVHVEECDMHDLGSLDHLSHAIRMISGEEFPITHAPAWVI